MAIDIYTHADILEVVQRSRTFHGLLGPMAFGSTKITDTKYIGFDEVTSERGVTPMVLPMAKGNVLAKQGYQTSILEAGYAKELATVTYEDTQIREPGSDIHAPSTNTYEAELAKQAVRLANRYTRLKEWMGSQILRTGKVVVSSPEYPMFQVDFQRNANLTVQKTTTARWGETGVSPVDDVEDFIENMEKPCATIVMGRSAFKLFKKDPQYKDLMHKDYNQLQGTAALTLGPVQKTEDRSHIYVGRLTSLDVDIVIYNETIDIDGVSTPLIGEYDVIFIPAERYGVMGYGAIQDADASYKGMPFFFKNWVEKNPGVPFLLLQGAPLPFHTMINATGCMTVHDGL